MIGASTSDVDLPITVTTEAVMGNFLWNIIKASPKFTGWAIASFAWTFLIQVFYLTITGLLRFHDIKAVDASKWHDYVWFIYSELPSMLPMVTVFSVSITVVMLISGIYIRTGYTVGELPNLIRTRFWVFLFEILLPIFGMITLGIGFFLRERLIIVISLMLLSAFFSHKMVSILITWTRVYVDLAARGSDNLPDHNDNDANAKEQEEAVSVNTIKDNRQ